jgi:ABC-type hemin transport system ATPase subunit
VADHFQAGNPDAFENGGELRAVSALSGGDQQRQRLATLFATQVQLRGPPTP